MSERFDAVAAALEGATSLDRLEARGTLRIALKAGGLDAAKATGSELAVVIQRVLPRELVARGVADAESVCADLARTAESLGGVANRNSPEAMFERLDG